MRRFNRLFLYYCTILAVFITLSTPFPFQIVVLPVSLYLLHYSFTHIFRLKAKGLEETLTNPSSSRRILIFILISLLIIGISVLKLSLQNSEQSLPTKEDKAATGSAVIIKKIYPTLIYTLTSSPSGTVNIYSEATKSSSVIAKAKNGQGYRSLSEQNQWIKISLDQNYTGWIEKKFVIFSQDKPATNVKNDSSSSGIKNIQ